MRDKTVKPWLLAASIAALLTPSISDAAGLGRLAVLSALGQPLNAEIEIIQAQKGESIVARLAPYETYQQANVQYNPALVGTRLSVEKRPNGQLFLKATTPRPISEPFVELVVELNSENGRVTRQYTILLDPPGYGRGMAELPPPPAPAAVRPPVASTEDAPAPAAPVASSPAPAAPEAEVAAADSSTAEPQSTPEPRSTPIQPAPAPSTAAPVARPATARAEPSTDQYGPVKPGENLFGIARSVKPEGATIEQTLVGIFRNNPDAFIKKNMNLVRSGKILRIPEASEILAVPQRDAARELHVQISDFNTLRDKLADNAGAAKEAGSVTSGRIGARVEEAGATEARDTVRLSKGEAPSGKAARIGGSADRVRALEEEAVAREKALAEANERIAQLEKTIKDMQRLTDLKNSSGAAGQSAANDKAAAAQPVTPKGGIPTAAVISAAPADTAKPAAKEPAKTDKSEPSNSPSADSAKAGGAAGAGKPESADSKPMPVPAAKAKDSAPASPSEDILETVMNEPLYLAAGGAAVLLGGLGIMMVRRRRKADDERDEDTKPKIAPTFAPVGKAAAGAAGASAVAGATVASAMPKRAPERDMHTREEEAPETQSHAATAMHDSDESEYSEEAEDAHGYAAHDASAHTDSAAVAEETVAHDVPEPEFSVNVPNFDSVEPASEKAPELVAHNFGVDDAPTLQPESHAAAATAEHGSNVVDFNLDGLPSIDAPAEVATAQPAVTSTLEEFKLDDLDLNLGAAPAAGGGVKDDHWYDVQQKFDLAKAYEEMGDKDGAREILQEVMKEGDTEQQAQAGKLLGSLS